MLNLVGSKWMLPVVLVLAVGLIFFGLIQYGKNTQEQENLNQQLQTEIETRERIDDAIRNSPTDPNAALEFLRNRQSD